MSTVLQQFSHKHFGRVRAIEENAKIFFCGRDVAIALRYANTNDALVRHCKGVVKRYPLPTSDGVLEVRFITEGDLYRLIASSKLPTAQAFEQWIVDEVVPTIRSHGVYAIDELLRNDEFLKQAITLLRSEWLKRFDVDQALAEAQPKVSYYDLVLQSPSLITVTEIAKDYGLSAKKLNALLHDAGVQFKQSGRWFLYADHADRGYTQSKTHEYDGGKTRTHMYWTQKGRMFIYDLLKHQIGLLPVVEQNVSAA